MSMGKSKLYGTIDKAYCYELDAVLDPYVAMDRGVADREHHFYCPTKGCAWRLKPGVWSRETDDYVKAWFVTSPEQDHVKNWTLSHEGGCPYRDERHGLTSNGGGEPPDVRDSMRPAFPFIPGQILAERGKHRVWPTEGPGRATIIKDIENAVGRGVDGTVEEVADAHLFLRKRWQEFKSLEERCESPDKDDYSLLKWRLDISGTSSNYVNGFAKIESQGDLVDQAEHWRTHVFHAGALVRKAKDGTFFLYPWGNRFAISIDPKAATGLKKKDYIAPVLERAAKLDIHGKKTPVQVYFWDIQPLGNAQEGKFPIEVRTPDRILRLAIREVVPQG